MRAILPILVKEYRHIVRDRRSVFAALAVPVLMLVLFGYAISLDVKHVSIAVIDRDRTFASRQLQQRLTADGTVEIELRPPDEKALERMLEREEVRLGIVIPPGYGEAVSSGETAPIQVLVDGTEASFAAQALGHLQGNLRHQTEDRLRRVLRLMGRKEALPTLRAEPRVFFNEALDSQWFIIPGLIAVIIMQLAAMLTSQCVAREYERNTIEQILVSPVNGPALMLGKLIPYLGLGVIQVGLVTTAARVLFQVPIRGSLGTLAVATVLYLMGAMALGLLLSAALKSQQVAMQVSLLASILPSFLLSGFIFPITNMPGWLQALSYAVPARYYVSITRGLFLKGVGVDVLWPELVAMTVFAGVLLAAGVTRFRRSLA